MCKIIKSYFAKIHLDIAKAKKKQTNPELLHNIMISQNIVMKKVLTAHITLSCVCLYVCVCYLYSVQFSCHSRTTLKRSGKHQTLKLGAVQTPQRVIFIYCSGHTLC